MHRTKWFERKFARIDDNGLLPGIIERLEGVPARLAEKAKGLNSLDLSMPKNDKWSIKKEIGHLIDIEPLWLRRMEQIAAGQQDLMEADLKNTKTHQTDHDSRELKDLIDEFRKHRVELLGLLRQMKQEDLNKAAKHPRLGTPMKVIDLAFFVAEHDDHHLAQITFLQN